MNVMRIDQVGGDRVGVRRAAGIRVLGVVAALVMGSAAMGQSLTLLGNPAGYVVTYSQGISDDGRVVTGLSEGASPVPSFIGLSGVRQDLTTPSGLSRCFSINVSGDGSFLAIQARTDGSTFAQGGRYRISDGSYTLINSPFSSTISNTSSAISRDGSVVAGWSSNPSTGVYKPWYWTGTGDAVQITVGNNEPALTSDISSDGRFICGYNPASAAAPFVFDRQTNSTTRLTGLGRARAINSSGNIVVGDARDSFGYSRPARWDNGVLQFITDAYQNMGDFSAYDVSADGSVITCGGILGFQGPVSMIWSASTGLLETRAFFESYGIVIPAGLSFDNKIFVSADGKTFTGSIGNSTTAMPFVATIPGAGGGSFVVGLVMAVGTRRRR
jgi:hypothetical protein